MPDNSATSCAARPAGEGDKVTRYGVTPPPLLGSGVLSTLGAGVAVGAGDGSGVRRGSSVGSGEGLGVRSPLAGAAGGGVGVAAGVSVLSGVVDG